MIGGHEVSNLSRSELAFEWILIFCQLACLGGIELEVMCCDWKSWTWTWEGDLVHN
jgi:hypothetical protein